jgi:hypothetical protein
LRLNGRALGVAASARLSPRHARWTLMAMSPGSVDGDTSGVRITVILDRIVSAQRLHEDITVQAYGGQPPPLLLEMVAAPSTSQPAVTCAASVADGDSARSYIRR